MGMAFRIFLLLNPVLVPIPIRARRDPQFVENELEQLVDEAHARGIYVIFDIVLNHTGDVFEYTGFGSVAP